MDATPEPVLHALLLCDHLLQEANGKWSCIGVFDRLVATVRPTSERPLAVPRVGIFFSFGDYCGECNLRLQIIHLNTQTSVGELRNKVVLGSKLASCLGGVSINDFRLPHLGKYEIRFMINDREVGSRTFNVDLAGESS